jgi:hypothetical protein
MIHTVIIIFVFTFQAGAQQSPPKDSLKASSAAPPDTGFTMQKSPLGAVIRSAILPGLGQLYNESYWKIPIILGVTAYLLDGYFNQNTLFVKYRDMYAATITKDQPSGELTWKLYREFYRDQRDTFAWWLAVTYFIQIADAFVDAHLFDFDVSDTKRVHALLAPGRISLSIRF